LSVVPPSESDPVPVRPWPGVQVITSELTVMPEATDKLPRDMVKEPEITPAASTIDPDAATLVPKRVTPLLA